ncbi:MAG: extracellular solute-binding protein [Lachnospiraceae bacterium]|nr:extracellular solute-binding protein [Lachnospiraceae bacterium]
MIKLSKRLLNNIFKIKIKKIICIVACVSLITGSLVGCGNKKKKDIPTIQLSLWGDERSVPLLEDAVSEFQKLHEDEVKIEYTISLEGENTCKETILGDPEHAADIFAFADDQFDELYRAGTLLEITYDADEIIDSVGGKDSGIADVVTRDGKVYAYPMTAGNGYFLYYNKAYFNDDDLKTLDAILDVAAENQKKFTMDFSNGWYIYSFFKGAGLELSMSEDGLSNYCNWNATDTKYKGIDVAQAMLDIASHPGFVSYGDDDFVKGVQDGEIIAGVNGAWNAGKVEAAWGEDYGAVKLPTYTINGEQVQMCSFAGYKLIGISAYTKYPEWSMKLAEYITNEDNQLKRFETIGECPVNVKAAQSEKVLEAPAIAALAEQSVYGNVQRVAQPFWDAAVKYGITIAGQNSGGRDLQELLDIMVEEATKPVVE